MRTTTLACTQCGWDCLPTALGRARHAVRHLEWERAQLYQPVGRRGDDFDALTKLRRAWQDYAEELEAANAQLHADVAELERRLKNAWL